MADRNDPNGAETDGDRPVRDAGPAPDGVDVSRPSTARLYDYYLGGSDNFAVDREVADRLIARAPDVRDAAWANRGFHGRAARWMAGRGIRQFIDIGCGLPTRNNTHDTARLARPDARVAYVDCDPQVAAHARAIMAGHEDGIAVVTADVRDPGALLADPGLRRLIDLREPAGLLMTAVMHFVADDDDPHGLVGRYVDALAPGSYLALSHGTTHSMSPRAVAAGIEAYSGATEQLHLRTRAEIERFFDGLEIVPPYEGAEPAVTPVGMWGAVDPVLADSDGSRLLLAAVARKP